MTPETEMRIYELIFGDGAHPEHLKDHESANKDRIPFEEGDLLEELEKWNTKSYLFEKIQGSLQEEGWDINKGVSD